MAVTVTHRSRIAAASVVLLVSALSACSTSFGAQTGQVYNPARGVNDRSGAVDVLNAVVVSAEEGSGTVSATLVNNSESEPDRLTAVSVDGQDAELDSKAGSTEIDTLGHVNLGASGAVSATGDGIKPGSFVDVTFTFEHGKAVTVQAPVVPNTEEWATVPVSQSAS